MNEESCIAALTVISSDPEHWIKLCIRFLKNNSDFNYDEIYDFYKKYIIDSPGLISELFEIMIYVNKIIPEFKFNYVFLKLCIDMKKTGFTSSMAINDLQEAINKIKKDAHEKK